MKKIFIAFAFISTLLSCKKLNKKTTTSTTSSSSDSCGYNSNINFTSKGTPIGKFASCIKDIDGNVYKTVVIGKQVWMAENLKVSKFNDGTIIDNIIDNERWSKTTAAAWCSYQNDSLNNVKYGKLYNWYVINPSVNTKNVCPIGWHIPRLSEWGILTDFLGGLTNGTTNKMKEVGDVSWEFSEIGTNTSLFTALPGGQRDKNGEFKLILQEGDWWGINDDESDKLNGFTSVKAFRINRIDGYYYYNTLYNTTGSSIRCLKD